MSTLKMEKRKNEVVIFTGNFKIEGEIHTLEGERITDFMCSLDKKQFIPVTNASIYKIDGLSYLYKADYISLNKDDICLLIPREQLKQQDSSDGSEEKTLNV